VTLLGDISIPDYKKLSIKKVTGHEAETKKEFSEIVKVAGLKDPIGFREDSSRPIRETRKKDQGCKAAIETPNEIVPSEEGAVPVGIERHDKVKGNEREDKAIQDR